MNDLISVSKNSVQWNLVEIRFKGLRESHLKRNLILSVICRIPLNTAKCYNKRTELALFAISTLLSTQQQPLNAKNIIEGMKKKCTYIFWIGFQVLTSLILTKSRGLFSDLDYSWIARGSPTAPGAGHANQLIHAISLLIREAYGSRHECRLSCA